MWKNWKIIARAMLALLAGGCVIAPPGLKDQQKSLKAAGAPYTRPVGKRDLPYVPFQPTWQQILRRAFLADADLEVAYDQWAGAVAKVSEAGAYPNTPATVGFNYLFSSAQMTSWDRTTLTIAPDAMTDLSLPSKLSAASTAALDDAKAAAQRFYAAKFAVQRKVLVGYAELVAMDQKLRIQQENVDLLAELEQEAQTRVQAGGMQRELITSQVDLQMARNELLSMRAQHEQMEAALNVLMGRDAEAAILVPPEMPNARPLPADDGTLLTVAVDLNPELAALAEQVQGRQDAIQVAKMQYLPDINPAAAITGNLSQSIGAIVTLPFTSPKINAQVQEAEAALAESQAFARQTRENRAASFVVALIALRDDERAANLLQNEVLPRAAEAVQWTRDAYSAGQAGFTDLIEAQRILLQVRTQIVEARMDREKQLAQLEELAGRDLGTLQPLPFFKQRQRPLRLHDEKGPSKPRTQPSPDEIFIQ